MCVCEVEIVTPQKKLSNIDGSIKQYSSMDQTCEGPWTFVDNELLTMNSIEQTCEGPGAKVLP